MGAARLQEAMDVAVDAVDVLIGMSQTPGNVNAIIEGRGDNSQAGPRAPSTGREEKLRSFVFHP
jgi:hypothetical protein